MVTKIFKILVFLLISWVAFCVSANELPTSIKHQANIIIDVRSPKEFLNNSNPDSINIPIDQLESKLSTLDKENTIIVCCASGKRSAIAEKILKNNGFKHIINVGSWRNAIL